MRYWLELLIKKMGRTAFLCYDELEDAEHINERRVIDVVSSEDNVSKLREAIAIIKSEKY